MRVCIFPTLSTAIFGGFPTCYPYTICIVIFRAILELVKGQRYVFIQLYLKGQSPSNMDGYSISAADYHKQYCTITFLIRFANMHVRAYKKRSYFWEVLILISIYCLYTCLYIMQSSRACLYCVQCPVYTCLCTEYTCMCTMYSTVYFVHAFLRFTVHACVLCT